MEDTVVLEFNLSEPVPATRINPNSYELWSPPLDYFITRKYLGLNFKIQSYCTVLPQEKRLKKYVPRLIFERRLSNGALCNYLYVEFSVSKLLFGNNFQEFRQKNFNEMAVKLRLFLENRGIHFTLDEIKKAVVKEIHYSINCSMPKEYTAYDVVCFLKKADIPRTKNRAEKQFPKNGESAYIYTNNKSVVLYDKIAELENAKRTEQGNLEKDSYCQFDLLNQLRNNKKEELRFEVRYENKNTILRELDKVGFKFDHNPTFEELINDKIAKKVLQEEYAYIVNRIPGFATNDMDIGVYTGALKRLNSRISVSALAKAVLAHEISTHSGMAALRSILCETNQQWYELKKSLTKLNYPSNYYDPLEPLRKRLDGL